ncbi:hypothetical protein BB560_002395 [Smittium megazygosporum]|uniref:Pterin-binding domain-containing protein n=1 Tax=Smittium megazygosporum TaxID=133381 RepID=A0A2T9ZEX0_9FUNG|nr:hypothetical protein BB560_002395 [Smittium megazygosporum]
MDTIEVHDLEIRAKIGKDPWERSKLQPLLVTVKIQCRTFSAGFQDKVTESVHYGKITKQISAFVEAQKLESMEALAIHIAFMCFIEDPTKIYGVFVTLKKPKALLYADSASISIYRSREDLLQLSEICKLCLNKSGISFQTLNIEQLSTLSQTAAEHENLSMSLADAGILKFEDQIVLNNLRLRVLLGVNLWERYSKQDIHVDLTIHVPKNPSSIEPDLEQNYSQFKPRHDFRKFANTVLRYVEDGTSYLTVEALALAISRVAILECDIEKISVLIKKPAALMFAKYSAVRITKTREQLYKELELTHEFESRPAPNKKTSPDSQSAHIAYISAGSNLGDRLKNINSSIKMINSVNGCKVVDTGFLYESKPMYLLDQPLFLNTAFKVETSLAPHDLLHSLKKIEKEAGRDFGGVRFGPRVLDLDILFYDNLVLNTDDLVIPHPRVHERHFQLRPVCDMDPYVLHPVLGLSIQAIGRQLTTHKGVRNDLVQVMPLSNSESRGKLSIPFVGKDQKNTIIMGILNTTPDSFSDGGLFSEIEIAVQHTKEMIASGATIVDVGGQSTRPTSKPISAEEEFSRIAPTINAIQNLDQRNNIFVSVDTFFSSVAEKAIHAGVDIINDISGGVLDPNILKVAADNQCPIILMHMRGNPQTMFDSIEYYVKSTTTSKNGKQILIDDIILTIRQELAARVRNALDAGIPRFNIILDPGIGFSKNPDQNFEILRRLEELTLEQPYSTVHNPYTNLNIRNISKHANYEDGSSKVDFQYHERLPVSLLGFPILVGTSRKSFLGKITGKENPLDREFSTAATVTSSIHGGASIVRVHNVEAAQDVVKVADKTYRL